MRLESLRLEPAGPTGWSSRELNFGEHMTELFGPNGCGKTPIIQSIAYALGYPVKFRDDVAAKCAAAVLTLSDTEKVLHLRRRIGSQFDVQASQNGERRAFYSEKDYTAFLFDVFDFPKATLTSTGSEPVAPYMATLLPIFYLDQDHGYSTAYRPPATFIKDQYPEMIRLIFGLPPKHSYEQRKLVIERKRRLEQLDRLIVRKQEKIEELLGELGGKRRALAEVDEDILEVRASLESLRASKHVRSDAYSAVDGLIRDKKSEHRGLVSEVRELQLKVSSFSKIQHEIELEVNTLSLNEEARRLFSSFKDICSKPDCGLFLAGSDTYAKSLLYLKDQIKDLQRNAGSQQARIEQLENSIQSVTAETEALEERRESLDAGDEIQGLVDAISQLSRRLYDLQSERQAVEETESSEKEYVEYLNARNVVQNDLASLSGLAGKSDLRALELRAAWRERLSYWLDTLKTRNVSREIAIDPDFGLLFGAENVAQFHGSTLTRVVLAVHTSIFDLYTRDESKKFRFLILDTPRQQDIERDVLQNYIMALKNLAESQRAQVVFSTSEFHYVCGAGDREWNPDFDGFDQKMFLG